MGVIEHIPGQLIIKEYPTKSASTRTISTHLEKLKQKGINPDMIIVDYADLLKPTASGSRPRSSATVLATPMKNCEASVKCGTSQYGQHPRPTAAD